MDMETEDTVTEDTVTEATTTEDTTTEDTTTGDTTTGDTTTGDTTTGATTTEATMIKDMMIVIEVTSAQIMEAVATIVREVVTDTAGHVMMNLRRNVLHCVCSRDRNRLKTMKQLLLGQIILHFLSDEMLLSNFYIFT